MGIKLIEIADVIRSKNAGPYELTFDILFKSAEWFEKVKNSGVINKNFISSLLCIPEANVLDIINFQPAAAIKITIKRSIVSGDIGETDVYGAQQHAPFLKVEFEGGDLNEGSHS